MREIPLLDHAGLADADRDALCALVATHRTLADVLRWAANQSPPIRLGDIVTQDEYTHDVLLPLATAASRDASPLWLAYDTT